MQGKSLNRMNITDKKILNATQLQRTKEMKRLAETKLSNIEENLEQLRKQQVFLRRYNKLKLDLKQEKARLFELNKQQASMADDIRQLERYQMCEAIQGTFQRVNILEKLTNENNRSLSELKREGDELNQSWSAQEKLQAQMQNHRRSAEEKHHMTLDSIFHALSLQGFTQACEDEIENLSELTEKATQQLRRLECNTAEVKQNIEALTGELAQNRAKRQGMEIHESTVKHAERILLLLDNLQNIEEEQQRTKTLQTESLQKQEEENRMLEKVFSRYQDITSEIETLEAELHTHKSNILGQDSYKLQERAMQLKSLKQMLISAQSLWHQISVGYRSIEEKVRTLNELRLHIENTERNIAEMETEVGKLSRLCHEKEHTYLLSKGQNIIQLRADLKEGVSCSVCGATHHPYHSDTMLDQSKLIGEFKTDYELLSAELRGKRKLLDELRLDLAESKGRQFSEESSLNAMRIRQNDDVREWGIYASLDPSFKDCTPSTNLDARMTLIRHMIESTCTDAEEAQKELDTFNYHMLQITKLGEQIQKLDSQKREVTVHLNEVNTACQVRVGQVDRVTAMIDEESIRFGEIYHHLEENITIKDWKGIWDHNKEGLREQIITLRNNWNSVNRDIDREQQELDLLNAQYEVLLEQQKSFRFYLELVRNTTEDRKNRIEENEKAIRQATGENGPKEMYNVIHHQMTTARQSEEAELERTTKMQHDMDYLRGRNEFHVMFGKELSRELSRERSRLDLWIRNFNMHHPPVQYAELQEIFNEEKDWESSRSVILNVQRDVAVCQSRVDDLNSRLLSLQADGNYHNANDETVQESLAAQQESLESKRNEILMQIARLTVVLEEHEKAVHSANNSASDLESEPEMC